LFRLHSRTGGGGRRRLWLGVATVVALLAAAAPAQAAPFAYVTNAGDGVSQYDVGAGGLLAPLSPATVAAHREPLGVAVSPDGRSVYVTNDMSDNISQYDVGPGGALTPKTPATVTAGDRPSRVAISPDGRSVYVTDSGDGVVANDTVSQYDVDAGGALTPKTPATVAAGDFPFGVAVSPDGRSVYVTNGNSNDISQYDVGPGGVLSPKTQATVAAAGLFPTELAVSPDGRSVYVTN
jgi:DNA-binding beta-propeller fold protein YncE